MLTDNDIIKALEKCCVERNCDGCPFRGSGKCINDILNAALSLINRQLEEIEMLMKRCYELDVKREEIQSTVATVMLRNMELALETAKADAIKEFVDKLIADLALLAKHEDEFRQGVICGVIHTIEAKKKEMAGG